MLFSFLLGIISKAVICLEQNTNVYIEYIKNVYIIAYKY